MERLNEYQLRRVADELYDGEPRVAHLMMQIRAFKKGDQVLLWLCRNGIKGKKMIEFFHNENDDDKTRGVLLGVRTALDYIEGRKFTSENLKSGDLK